ncbi:hypothetical protein ACGFRG_18150 [Streptomyces sp. NPDC048696]|uniref:hypothetical protein n=1 Tax=Streptomyces sp. NPDC048696 TaxID=3365585 RepID=UPI00371C984C
MDGHEGSERPVETRLRRAFAARAQTITVHDLRPADPPGPRPRRTAFALPRLHGRPTRRFALPLAALATVAAVAIGYVALAPDRSPARPATPGPVAPLPSSSPSPALSPQPQPSRPPTGTGATGHTDTPPAVPMPGASKATRGGSARQPASKPGRRPSELPTARPSTSPSSPPAR